LLATHCPDPGISSLVAFVCLAVLA
jgi:hypothetical protein